VCKREVEGECEVESRADSLLNESVKKCDFVSMVVSASASANASVGKNVTGCAISRASARGSKNNLTSANNSERACESETKSERVSESEGIHYKIKNAYGK
jgi:hypothetical protein